MSEKDARWMWLMLPAWLFIVSPAWDGLYGVRTPTYRQMANFWAEPSRQRFEYGMHATPWAMTWLMVMSNSGKESPR